MSLQRSLIKSHTNYTLPLTNQLGVTPLAFLAHRADFKKPPFKLEEQGWGEFDMGVQLHFAEKGGSKDLAHDLHFQVPKYEITHVVVCPNKVSLTP
jgi:transcription initiation factor TFIID/TFIIF subunit